MRNIPVGSLVFSFSSSALLLLTGCALQATSTATPDAGISLQGRLRGGQQPVIGASVYLFAVNTAGYGGRGLAAGSSNTSVSLLNGSVVANEPGLSGQDSNGNYYVTTDSKGGFAFSGSDFSCISGQQLYLYAVGGNAGAGINSAAASLAALGNCSGLGGLGFFTMNEVSTVAAAYALAGFATDATHISSSGTALAQTGVANAMLNAANLETLNTGASLAVTPAGNGTVPQAEINSLADILSTCVNSSGAGSQGCSTLLSTATSDGTSTGTKPTDTATAAIYLAQNPGANVTTLYSLIPSAPPFNPTLVTQPNDWTIAIQFTGGGLNGPEGIAIDASGNVWAGNTSGSSVSQFSSSGAAISGTGGYTGGGLDEPVGIAIDASGNVWATNYANNTLSKFTSSGSPISSSGGYSGGGLLQPIAIAFDPSGNVWILNNLSSLSKFSSSGKAIISGSGSLVGRGSYIFSLAIDISGNVWATLFFGQSLLEVSPSDTFIGDSMGGGLNYPQSNAIDASGNIWVGNQNNGIGGSLSKFSSSGAAISGSGGYTGGGLNLPDYLSIDGSGNVWSLNYLGGAGFRLSEFNASGVAITGSQGYPGVGRDAGLAIDGSGNVWVTTEDNNTLTEFVGIATPVVTPLVANLIAPYTHAASKP